MNLPALPRVSPLVLGTALIATVAFAGSTSHVLKLAEANGQGGWLAWTIAGTVEALAVLSAMEIRHRVRHGMPRKAPTAVLVATVVFLQSANLATAEPTPWGYTLAVVQPTVLLLALALIETRPTSRRNSKPSPSSAKSGSKPAPVVPATPVVSAAPRVAPQKPRVASDTPRPSRQAVAEEIALACVEPADVIPKARPILAGYGITGKTAERTRADARAIVTERLNEVLEVAR
jgi:hypothetical protein